jgi:hypothetical protein
MPSRNPGHRAAGDGYLARMGDDGYQFATSDDVSAIATLVRAHSDPASVGYPAFVEPEPESVKGRFGRVKETSVDHSVGLHTTVADGSVSIEAMFMVPCDAASQVEAGTRPLAVGWFVDETMPGSGRLFTRGPVDPDLTARWLVDTLVALGAETPTGRWRCSSPEMPRWWHSS